MYPLLATVAAACALSIRGSKEGKVLLLPWMWKPLTASKVGDKGININRIGVEKRTGVGLVDMCNYRRRGLQCWGMLYFPLHWLLFVVYLRHHSSFLNYTRLWEAIKLFKCLWDWIGWLGKWSCFFTRTVFLWRPLLSLFFFPFRSYILFLFLKEWLILDQANVILTSFCLKVIG